MRFARYDAYRNTDYLWLKSIPAHWIVGRFRDYFTESSEKISDEVVGVMLSVSGYRGVEVKEYDDENRRRSDEDLKDYRIVRVGQLVVNSMWLNAGGLGISRFEGHVSPAYRSYWVSNQLNLSYIHHLLRSGTYIDAYTSMVQGIRPNSLQLPRTDLLNLPVLIPPPSEQRAIAAFLDAETSKIDALVAEQRRLIELLKEKRQAVISHAVTKGLNPHVKMKPSGIDWLGDVPKHWEVVPLKHLVSMPIIDGPHESPQKRDEGVPFVSAEAISKGILDFDKKWGYISIEDHKRYSLRYSPKRGDILLVKLGATAGIPAIVDSDIDFNIWVPLAAIRLKPNVQSRFIFHVLRSSNLTMAYELNWTFGTQQTLGLRTISNLQMPLPPWEEQLGIVNRLDPLLLSIESLIAEAQMAISLLQERRTALISAAVTGKIDVRGFVPKEASA